MRIRRIGRLAIATACALLASPALAEDDDFARKGYYLVGAGTYGIEMLDPSPLSVLILTPLSTGNSWGMNVRAGNRVDDWLAFELEYEWMKGFEVDQLQGSPAAPVPAILAVYHPDIVTVNAKFYLPFGRFQPYLLVGGGLASYDVEFTGGLNTLSRTDNGFAFRGGAGVDAYLTRHIVFFAEGSYVINTDSITIPLAPTGEATTIDELYYVSITAGFAYRF